MLYYTALVLQGLMFDFHKHQLIFNLMAATSQKIEAHIYYYVMSPLLLTVCKRLGANETSCLTFGRGNVSHSCLIQSWVSGSRCIFSLLCHFPLFPSCVCAVSHCSMSGEFPVMSGVVVTALVFCSVSWAPAQLSPIKVHHLTAYLPGTHLHSAPDSRPTLFIVAVLLAYVKQTPNSVCPCLP